MPRVPSADHWKTLSPVLVALAIFAITPLPVTGQPVNGGLSFSRFESPALAEADSRISSHLIGLVEANRSMVSSPAVTFDRLGRVRVLIRCDSVDEALLRNLRRVGVGISGTHVPSGTLTGWVMPSRLRAVAMVDGVRGIRPPIPAFHRTGSVTSEGDVVHQSSVVRGTTTLSGAGVRVGVISTGINNLALSQASGDIPASVIPGVTAISSRGDGDLDAGGDGTALLEIITDIAPNAELYFTNAELPVEFVNAVDLMRNTFGVDIVLDNLGYFGQPFFADGFITTAVEEAVADGITWITAAGNEGDTHWEGDYVDINPLTDTVSADQEDFHDFGGGDEFLAVTISPHSELTVVMQWNDEFGASGNDYNLFLYDAGESTLLEASLDTQNGDDDPLEFVICQNNSAAPLVVNIAVDKYSPNTDQDVTLELFALGRVLLPGATGQVVFNEHSVASGSIFGHPGSEDVITVGAIGYSDPGWNNVQDFSSRGPVRIDFPALDSRSKPNICGIDEVTVTGNGPVSVPFTGTSVAAAHVAGIAALLLEHAPHLDPTGIRAGLQSGAVDIETAGFDNISGAGRADALATITGATTVAAQSWNLYR
ncbi:S8 family serine peptidase [Candidatus Sumerlaeota bacterium]|nr:S8 family serine peptidase [Candidatus Sumerlaeota bacterium]